MCAGWLLQLWTKPLAWRQASLTVLPPRYQLSATSVARSATPRSPGHTWSTQAQTASANTSSWVTKITSKATLSPYAVGRQGRTSL
jgi:hypothetical protein